ncbi:DUF4214 domain-containing protein [Marinomonas sp. 2405UD66-6]|uniref:DUF4214 domain-containing protein n=1 Tax=Marinomonas sp. 2405UD66-6 TaxID=3391834 RepID=UPI0039C975CE
MSNKLVHNTEVIDFDDLALRIDNAVLKTQDEDFKAFVEPMPSSFKLSLEQLLSLQDQLFVEACFCRILGREADEGSINHYLRKLKKGYDPRAIIAFLRYSEEGKQRFEDSDQGLPSLRKYRVFALPMIGQLVTIIFALYKKLC